MPHFERLMLEFFHLAAVNSTSSGNNWARSISVFDIHPAPMQHPLLNSLPFALQPPPIQPQPIQLFIEPSRRIDLEVPWASQGSESLREREGAFTGQARPILVLCCCIRVLMDDLSIKMILVTLALPTILMTSFKMPQLVKERPRYVRCLSG
jgi:hypothetical protein